MVETWLRDWDDPLNLDKCGYYGSECDGGYADFTKVDQRNVHPVESDLSDAEIATFATSWVTAENMLNRANVVAGDRVLIPGASGGVGSALVQLANSPRRADHRYGQRVQTRRTGTGRRPRLARPGAGEPEIGTARRPSARTRSRWLPMS